MHEWVTVARTQDVPDAELAAATLDGVRIVVANAGGECEAVADECTHPAARSRTTASSRGTACPASRERVRSQHRGGDRAPGTEPVAVYSVRVEGDEIQVARPVG